MEMRQEGAVTLGGEQRVRNKALIVGLAIIAVAAGVVIHRQVDKRKAQISTASNSPANASSTHSHATSQSRVPKFQTASETRNLSATLAPAQFIGKTREAYKVAREIPETLAQLPCYCHCDQSFGHKSLHSCFVDDHAAHCAVCTEEALLAYELQKEQRLNGEQIRKLIIEKYGSI